MTYLLYGLEEFLIDKKINSILKEQNINDIDIVRYDLESSSLKDIIDDAMTISLFSDKKAIIVENSYIFTGTINKKLPEQNNEYLNEYLTNQNNNTILIFKLIKDKIDSRKKISSNIKKYGNLIEFKNNNINEIVTEMIKPYHIDNMNINLLINRVGNNLNLLEQEINKIKTYKDKDLNITKEDILNLSCKSIDVDIFNLIDNIVANNKEKVIESYDEMLKLGEEPIKIIVMLANQFRIIYLAKKLRKKGYMEKDIASLLEIHPYRIKLALSKGYNFSEDSLLKYLEQLADLDISIKTGKIDKNLGLELFLLAI